MTCYFAFPASPALSADADLLLKNFDAGIKAPQNTLFVTVAQLYADEIVDALLLNIVRAADPHSTAAKVLEKFAGLIKSTVHAMIKQVMGKMNNEELKPLAAVIRERRVPLSRDGQTQDYVTFPIPADFFAQYKAILAQAMQGERHPEQMTDCMLRFSDMAYEAFYEDSVKRLKLGFVGRKMVEMGGAAINKGSHSAIRSLMPNLEGQELKDLAAYFDGLLIEA